MLIDPTLVEEIRRIERATGRNDVFSGLVRTLEGSVTGFPKSLDTLFPYTTLFRSDRKSVV